MTPSLAALLLYVIAAAPSAGVCRLRATDDAGNFQFHGTARSSAPRFPSAVARTPSALAGTPTPTPTAARIRT